MGGEITTDTIGRLNLQIDAPNVDGLLARVLRSQSWDAKLLGALRCVNTARSIHRSTSVDANFFSSSAMAHLLLHFFRLASTFCLHHFSSQPRIPRKLANIICTRNIRAPANSTVSSNMSSQDSMVSSRKKSTTRSRRFCVDGPPIFLLRRKTRVPFAKRSTRTSWVVRPCPFSHRRRGLTLF